MLRTVVVILLIILGIGILLGLIKWKKSELAFKAIVVLLIITFITDFIGGILPYFGYKYNVTVYKIFDPIQVVLFSYIFYQLYQTPPMKKFALYGCVVTLILLTISTIINIRPDVDNAIGVTMKCALYILLSLMKFTEMLRIPSEDNIVADPSFWFCSGVFFFFSVNIMQWVSIKTFTDENAKQAVIALHVYCNYIFYSIVAFSFLLIPFKKSQPLVTHE